MSLVAVMVLLLASIVFFSAILISMALMLRTHWDDLSKTSEHERKK
jgi:hypothetical protein